MLDMPYIAVLGFESAGWSEVLVLFVVILIVVGPKRLPSVARKLGRMMETFRRAADEFKAQVMTMDQEPAPEQPAPYPSDYAPTEQDGAPLSSAESSSGDAYNPPPQDSPYPGNEQYAEALNPGSADTPVGEPPPSPMAGEPAREPSPEPAQPEEPSV